MISGQQKWCMNQVNELDNLLLLYVHYVLEEVVWVSGMFVKHGSERSGVMIQRSACISKYCRINKYSLCVRLCA